MLDGEIVALKDGIPSFELLQQRMGLRDMRKLAQVLEAAPVIYYVFDILELDGKPLLKLPLIERKRILEKSVKTGDVIKVLPFFDSLDVVEKLLLTVMKVSSPRGAIPRILRARGRTTG